MGLIVNNWCSIQQIAEGPLADVTSAIKDAKAARSLHNACKARMKNPAGPSAAKRPASALENAAKRAKYSSDTGFLNESETVSPQEFESSFIFPVETDEKVIAHTVLLTNRAPLVLAFAIELLRYTMPEQPPSSRLSLAQAVVSANSRSKAASIGLEKGLSADEQGWGHGQPRVKVLGREVTVLKRGGYEWKQESPEKDVSTSSSVLSSATETGVSQTVTPETSNGPSWSVSQSVTLKGSTFIVRATQITEPSQRHVVMQSLFETNPSLQSASHNAWAYRIRVPTGLFGATTIKEESFDDGEAGCGDFLLKNMRETDAVGTLVVMTRWYGGVMLGVDRWRIMRDCLKDALAERLRVTGEKAMLGGEALWGLDLEAMRSKSGTSSSETSRSYGAGVVGMSIHRPETARAYLFKSFVTRVDDLNGDASEAANIEGPAGDERELPNPQKTTSKATPKKKTAHVLEQEREENVSRLLGAIKLLYDSWAPHLSISELDRRAWGWYIATRPNVDSGPSGWGAKGHLKLADILALRRKQ